MREQLTTGAPMPSPVDSDDLDAKAEKYRDHEFDRQYAEYERSYSRSRAFGTGRCSIWRLALP